MTDFLGNEIKAGDMVVFVKDSNRCPHLCKGTVKKIYSNDKECTVDSISHVYSNRLMKL